MEKLINCDVFLDIHMIENISGGNQEFEILVILTDGRKVKLCFDPVWDMRYSIENGYIDRATKFEREEVKKSSVVEVKNSDYIKYFEGQISGTRPTKELRDFILFDKVDTVVELLTFEEPKLEEIEG
ncbi:MAG: hypothetical protein LBI13_02015 [Streptococcaceae bacterium]|jgi:hypothetical protein|nr:hypothetical protein [Streptococcaceae bacterium]